MSGSLRDQLFKAGLVTQKQAEPRNRQRGPGNAGQPHHQQGGPKAERSPEEQEALDRQVAEVVGQGRLKGRLWGERRWYFIARDGRVPYVEVSDEVGEKLEAGALALTESPEGTTAFVDAEAAGRVLALDPAWVRFFKK